MRFLLGALLACAITIPVHGQSALTELATQMPKCALQCYMKVLPSSACATNLTSKCMCTDVALQTAVGACAKQSCTVYELLQTKNVSSKGCGVPVRNKGEKHALIGIIGFVLAALTFALRLAASLGERGRQLGWDDVTMGVVLLLAVPLPIFAPEVVKQGLGQDIWALKAEQITTLTKFYWIGEIFYVLTLGISKISILLFYLRVFPDKRFRQVTYATMAACAGYTIAFFFATIFQCTPISYTWTKWDGLHEGTCTNVHVQSWTAAAISISLDILVMILPLRQLAALQMGLAKKIMVMSMFSVGIFVLIVSAIRLETLIHFANSQNLTWDYADAGSWSLIEVYTSIICGCMPALRKLIVKMWPAIRSTFSGSKATSGIEHSGHASSAGKHPSKVDRHTRVSVSPRTGDEGDFVPLVDLDNGRSNASVVGNVGTEEKPSQWIVRTSSFGFVKHENASQSRDYRANIANNWDAGKPVSTREHV